ncbi:MAG TPA: hypothetical protein VJS86_02915, partial [Arthrobacter sp.]|nr:hypothetical protein [Arthrobacter sp.]
ADSFNIFRLRRNFNNLEASVNDCPNVVTRITTKQSVSDHEESHGKQNSSSCDGSHNAHDQCRDDPGNGTY